MAAVMSVDSRGISRDGVTISSSFLRMSETAILPLGANAKERAREDEMAMCGTARAIRQFFDNYFSRLRELIESRLMNFRFCCYVWPYAYYLGLRPFFALFFFIAFVTQFFFI